MNLVRVRAHWPGRHRDGRSVVSTVALAVVAGLALGACAAPTGSDRPADPPPSAKETRPVPDEATPPSAAPSQPSPNADATALLQRSIADGDADGVRRAIGEGADLEARDADRRTPLIVATRANRSAIARLLLEAGADPDAKDSIQDSAFLYAGAEGLDEILALTLKHGADVTSTNRYGGTALIPASEHAHVDTVRTLIDAGVPVNHVNNLGWTALHEAIVLGDGSRRHVTVVSMLLDAGADPRIEDRDGVPARRLAVAHGYDAIVAEIDRSRATPSKR